MNQKLLRREKTNRELGAYIEIKSLKRDVSFYKVFQTEWSRVRQKWH